MSNYTSVTMRDEDWIELLIQIDVRKRDLRNIDSFVNPGSLVRQVYYTLSGIEDTINQALDASRAEFRAW